MPGAAADSACLKARSARSWRRRLPAKMRCRVTSALPHSARAEPVEAPSLSSDKEERPFDKLRANGRWRFILCKFIVCNFANSHLHDCPCEGRRHLPDQPESPMSATIAEMERHRPAAALACGQHSTEQQKTKNK